MVFIMVFIGFIVLSLWDSYRNRAVLRLLLPPRPLGGFRGFGTGGGRVSRGG